MASELNCEFISTPLAVIVPVRSGGINPIEASELRKERLSNPNPKSVRSWDLSVPPMGRFEAVRADNRLRPMRVFRDLS